MAAADELLNEEEAEQAGDDGEAERARVALVVILMGMRVGVRVGVIMGARRVREQVQEDVA